MADYKFIDSAVIHGGISTDPYTQSVNVPIYQTSTFRQEGIGLNPKWEYARTGILIKLTNHLFCNNLSWLVGVIFGCLTFLAVVLVNPRF